MAADGRIRILIDLSDLQASVLPVIQRASPAIARKLPQIMSEAVGGLASSLRASTPVDTGHMASQWSVRKVGPAQFRVDNDARYALFVHRRGWRAPGQKSGWPTVWNREMRGVRGADRQGGVGAAIGTVDDNAILPLFVDALRQDLRKLARKAVAEGVRERLIPGARIRQ